jgi:hypothetical protein
MCQAVADDVGLKVRVIEYEPINQAATAIKAWGVAMVTFDSGRTEPRLWATFLAVPDVVKANKSLLFSMIENWVKSSQQYVASAERGGIPRHNRNGRRRFKSVDWVKP